MASYRAPSTAPAFFVSSGNPRSAMSTPSFRANCLDAFRHELTPQQFNTWIRPLRLEFAGDGLLLIAPNRFVLQWVKERFAARIEELATLATGRPLRVALAVADAPERSDSVAAPASSVEQA